MQLHGIHHKFIYDEKKMQIILIEEPYIIEKNELNNLYELLINKQSKDINLKNIEQKEKIICDLI